MSTGNGGIRGTMERASPKLEKLTRPEKYGGQGIKVLCAVLAVTTVLFAVDALVINEANIAKIYDAFFRLWGLIGGVTGLVILVRLFKK